MCGGSFRLESPRRSLGGSHLREVVNVARQVPEIMADVVASCLYAPALLADDYRSWVQQTFPLTAPGAAVCH